MREQANVEKKMEITILNLINNHVTDIKSIEMSLINVLSNTKTLIAFI